MTLRFANAVLLVGAGILLTASGCTQSACRGFPVKFELAPFMPRDNDLVTLPKALEASYDKTIMKCASGIDNRISSNSIKRTGVVHINGKVLLRYLPLYVTDTVYYFEVGKKGIIKNAYRSKF